MLFTQRASRQTHITNMSYETAKTGASSARAARSASDALARVSPRVVMCLLMLVCAASGALARNCERNACTIMA